VDGAENNPPSFYLSNHYEICPYYTLDEHLRLPDILVMNPDIYHGLPEDLQKILDDAVAESVDYQRKLWIEMEQDALSSVREAGVEVLKPDKAPFREAVQPVWDEFKGTQVGDLAEQIQQAR
jgi:TRAP-type C4-dicarboxylate transport system substrate-binding protein